MDRKTSAIKYMHEFRDGEAARRLAAALKAAAVPGRRYNFMEFCGGHTHTIFRYGLPALFPAGVRMIHGPGCPVCVLPVGRLDMALQLARRPGVTLCSYGDMLRVPGSQRATLLSLRGEGADIRMVYSTADALRIAQEHPDREVVFFAIGFETTTPPTAVAVREAQRLGLRNFSVFCNHVLTPAAIQYILEAPKLRELGTVPLDGFVGPGHVSTVIGTQPYEFFAEEYQRPVVITGFEPLDLLEAVLMLVRQVNENRYTVENQYTRAVTREGNPRAKQLVAEIFELRKSFEWRGLGAVPYSALQLKPEYAALDAERRFAMQEIASPDHPACACGAILRGLKQPTDCNLFGKVCTPDNPIGSCMVSAEGACAAYYRYCRHEHE